MFPFTYTYNRNFRVKVDNSKTIEIIENELKKLKVDKINISKSKIDFKNSFFNGQRRTHIMACVDSGYFELNQSTSRLEYSICFLRMFYITLGMSLFFGLISRNLWIGLLSFFWLFGMNLITALIRHKIFFKKLRKKILHTT